jgi:hypothetical protein
MPPNDELLPKFWYYMVNRVLWSITPAHDKTTNSSAVDLGVFRPLFVSPGHAGYALQHNYAAG